MSIRADELKRAKQFSLVLYTQSSESRPNTNKMRDQHSPLKLISEPTTTNFGRESMFEVISRLQETIKEHQHLFKDPETFVLYSEEIDNYPSEVIDEIDCILRSIRLMRERAVVAFCNEKKPQTKAKRVVFARKNIALKDSIAKIEDFLNQYEELRSM